MSDMPIALPMLLSRSTGSGWKRPWSTTNTVSPTAACARVVRGPSRTRMAKRNVTITNTVMELVTSWSTDESMAPKTR